MSRRLTEREKIILAYLDGFETAKRLKNEWEVGRLIRQAGWKADMLMHPGATMIWANDKTFPSSQTPAPPALERLPKHIEDAL